MAETEYKESFRPGNRALLSDEHDALVGGLKELNDRLPGITRQERAVLKMAVDLLDYMKWYAFGPTNAEYESLPEEEKQRRVDARREGPKTFTVDEFVEDLICSGGLELHHGRCAPRF